MTTTELEQRRKELAHAKKGISDSAPIQRELARLLDDVEAEEAERVKLAEAWPGGYPGH